MAKRILIVDDDAGMRLAVKTVLSSAGYEVLEASNHQEAELAMRSGPVHLAVLDVMMETDTAGFEVADRIRSRRANSRYLPFKDIPIIILTAINQTTNSRFSMDQADSFLPAVNEFLTKPVDIDELLDKVARSLG